MESTVKNNESNILSRQRQPRRKQILEEKKAIDELIKAANVERNHLAAFPTFHQFDTNGVSVCLESGSGDKLSLPLKRSLQRLVKDNMERHYGHEWAHEEKVKRREMIMPEARYIFVYEASNSNKNNYESTGNEIVLDQVLVGFVHYRFTLEEELPVLYVYEIQLDSCIQGKGLGKFLMQLIKLIAQKSGMSAVILTVQKANVGALDFYISKLGYNISSISPSMMGVAKSYEILCKAFGGEAKAILES